MNQTEDIIVSIICNTYNHEPYIRQCLDGFIMQKTTFAFEILIHDDASTDNTANIIREYEVNYPDIIKPIYQTENQYSKKTGIMKTFQYPRVKGKYIAFCEGDDYWIDPLKLQKQVDFLEENLEYVMVYTNAKKYYQSEGLLKNGYWGNCDNSYEFLLQNNPIATLTVLYRKEAISDYDKVINPSNKGWLLGDYPLWLWLSLQGKIKFLQEYTSVYRVLEQSASHFKDYDSTKRFALSSISVKEFFMGLFGVTYRKFINDSNNRLLFNLAYAYKNIDDVKYYYRKIVSKSIKDRLKYLISIIAQSK